MTNAALPELKTYTPEEELWCCIIHGIGAALSIAALVLLVTLSAIYGSAWTVVSTAVFGTSMIVLYSASTLYHAASRPELKRRLKKFDHISIYYLIAGSYTPFCWFACAAPSAGSFSVSFGDWRFSAPFSNSILRATAPDSGPLACIC